MDPTKCVEVAYRKRAELFHSNLGGKATHSFEAYSGGSTNGGAKPAGYVVKQVSMDAVAPVSRSIPVSESPVLAVDLDGTLVKTDLLVECVIGLLKQRPWCAFLLPIWLLKGTAYLKQQVARRASLDVTTLPYRTKLLDYLRMRRNQGARIVLATAADARLARQIADHLGVFDFVLASDGVTNLRGQNKRDSLVREFGEKGFDYAGNSRRDLPVWAAGRRAIVIGSPSGVDGVLQVDHVFDDGAPGWRDYVAPLRPQHWLKNLLIFVPLLAAHRLDDPAALLKLVLAFVAFGCAASSGYLANDLLDLPADRDHPVKQLRPFAAGKLPLSYALIMIPALLSIAGLLGASVSGLFLGALAAYFGLSATYSLYIKRIVILDVIFLAGLYTMRLLAGSAAVRIWPSHWLLALSTFLFLSLALVKRYGELAVMKRIDGDHAKARAYEIADGELLAAMGIASGYMAVLVLALYINSDKAQALYGRYQLIWLLCPLLLYWISDMWLVAHRGKMSDDPLYFAVKDRTSRVLILLMFVISILAL
jgi:4-hydroxybenzoate polyprenyltransferase/phosphoserine phosphatase